MKEITGKRKNESGGGDRGGAVEEKKFGEKCGGL